MKPAFIFLSLVAGVQANSVINNAMAVINKHFPNNYAFKLADATISKTEGAISAALGYDKTRNDLVNGECGDAMIIFARGTGEPGNVGGLVGPIFYNEVVKLMPGKNVSFQGIDAKYYPAVVGDYYAGGSTTGAERMASLTNKAIKECPKTAIVMSGWSQGAQVVHKAAAAVGSKNMGLVSSVVTFGDPDSAKKIEGIAAAKVKVICHEKDSICQFGSMLVPSHFTYARDTTVAAEFVVKNIPKRSAA